MCKLCEGKLINRKVKDGWLFIIDDQLPNGSIAFPVHYCPWCGKEQEDERMMPKITPREWKWQMQEQEAENYDPSEELC